MCFLTQDVAWLKLSLCPSANQLIKLFKAVVIFTLLFNLFFKNILFYLLRKRRDVDITKLHSHLYYLDITSNFFSILTSN